MLSRALEPLFNLISRESARRASYLQRALLARHPPAPHALRGHSRPPPTPRAYPKCVPSPQAFAELYVSSQLQSFGIYPEQPPEWDLDFVRPPINARNPLWSTAHPGADALRVDGVPNRERFCKEALENRASSACGALLSPPARMLTPLPTPLTACSVQQISLKGLSSLQALGGRTWSA